MYEKRMKKLRFYEKTDFTLITKLLFALKNSKITQKKRKKQYKLTKKLKKIKFF